jgi:transcriptional regulator with XRE-family HTH domain
MTFGEKLKEARKEAGLSQEQLAQKLSVSRSAVAKWESDKGMPDVNNLKAISQLLDVSVIETSF